MKPENKDYKESKTLGMKLENKDSKDAKDSKENKFDHKAATGGKPQQPGQGQPNPWNQNPNQKKTPPTGGGQGGQGGGQGGRDTGGTGGISTR